MAGLDCPVVCDAVSAVEVIILGMDCTTTAVNDKSNGEWE